MENNRATQFLPFDALKGFKEAIKEKEKIKVDKIILSSEDEEKLSYYLGQVKKMMMVELIYYKSNNYIKIKGIVSQIDYINKTITIVKTKIKMEDILSIKSDEFIEYDNYF